MGTGCRDLEGTSYNNGPLTFQELYIVKTWERSGDVAKSFMPAGTFLEHSGKMSFRPYMFVNGRLMGNHRIDFPSDILSLDILSSKDPFENVHTKI